MPSSSYHAESAWVAVPVVLGARHGRPGHRECSRIRASAPASVLIRENRDGTATVVVPDRQKVTVRLT
ncbi:hypothetical protein [Streptomyces spiralis]|uniref:hypothetical protein n=1 Tax=Streptomyces spiralis TaxID=66376 RepID=UPI0036CF0982